LISGSGATPPASPVEYSKKHDKLIPKPGGPDSTGFEFDLYAFHELPPLVAHE
jgi:hypothetical protein